MTAKLTGQVKAGGCASKLSPKILDQVLPRIPRVSDPNVLVGFDTADDAGVYRVTPDLAIVQTVDFFTPVVDDPYMFGAIAAANALSDVYAMGGRPLTALSILAWPASGDLDTLEEILKGGAEKIHEAGCVILGGHSVSDPEIKFGYAITGTVHPDRVKANTGARPGDVLMFTKKIGTGVISTALKKGIAKQEHVDGAILQMIDLESGRGRGDRKSRRARTNRRHGVRIIRPCAGNGHREQGYSRDRFLAGAFSRWRDRIRRSEGVFRRAGE